MVEVGGGIVDNFSLKEKHPPGIVSNFSISSFVHPRLLIKYSALFSSLAPIAIAKVRQSRGQGQVGVGPGGQVMSVTLLVVNQSYAGPLEIWAHCGGGNNEIAEQLLNHV